MLRGDFTTFAGPTCRTSPLTLAPSQGFVNNQISPSLISPFALKVAARLPQTSNPCGKVNFGLRSNQSEHMEIARLDWQASEKNSIFGRFFVTNLNIPTTFDGSNGLTLNRNGQSDWVYALSIGSTYLISANVVNSFRIGANRQEIPKIPDRFATWPELGVNAPFNPDTEPRITVAGGNVGTGGAASGGGGNGFNIGGGSAIINTDYGGPKDRKSTRLNSSHQIISYAVFCLKKKTFETFKSNRIRLLLANSRHPAISRDRETSAKQFNHVNLRAGSQHEGIYVEKLKRCAIEL